MLTIENKSKQPRQLYLLFFTELWERFGFYTLQTIIILYMTSGLHMIDQQANLLYAAFSALLYLTPTIGGYLADRYLGFQRSIMIGGILFILAYLICAVPNRSIFFLGLSILICANGFFKPNVSSIVGELYDKDDPRRDGGFTIFYMGINVGSLIPPIIAGTLVAHYGWHSGFILAAIGMAIGQIIFMFGKKHLHQIGKHPNANPTAKPLTIKFYTLLTIGVLACIYLCELAFKYAAFTDYLIEIAAALIILIIAFFILKLERSQQKRMLACLILIIISIAFWAIYNQTFTSLMLFANRNMQQHILGIPLDAEGTQFFNPFFIIVLSPILSRLWIKLDRVNLNPSISIKFSLAVLFMCLGFLLLAFGAHFFGNSNGQTSAWWLCASYCLQTIGELLISPIGLAMITVLCPKELVGMMMGVWFFSQAASFAIGGMLANIAAIPANVSVITSLSIYSHAFLIYGGISLIMAMISFALIPFIKKLTA